MPKIDLTITISIIVALCAIISPILTTIINNHYQLKLRKIELKQQEYERATMHERQLYEDYLKNAGRCVFHSDPIAQQDYGESYFTALMIAPFELRDNMVAANNSISLLEMEDAKAILEELSPKIHAILQTK